MSKAQINAKMTMDTSAVRKSISGLKGQFKSMAKSMASSMKTAALAAASALKTAFVGVIGTIGALITAGIGAALKSGFDQKVTAEFGEAFMTSVMGGAEQAKKAMKMIADEAKENPLFSVNEMTAAGSSLAVAAKKDVNKLKDLLETSQLLSTLNPMQGLDGAAFALKETEANDYISLQERFNVPKSTVNRLKGKGLKGNELVKEALKEMGINQKTLDDQAKTVGGTMKKLKNQWMEISRDLFARFAPQFNKIVTDLMAWVQANRPVILGFMTAVTSGLASGFKFAMSAGAKVIEWIRLAAAFVRGYIDGFRNDFNFNNLPVMMATAYAFISDFFEAIRAELMAAYFKSYNEIFESLWTGIKAFFGFVKTEGKSAMVEALTPDSVKWIQNKKDGVLAKLGNDAAQERISKRRKRENEGLSSFKDIFSPLDTLERASRARANNKWGDVGESWAAVREHNPMIKGGMAAFDAEKAKVDADRAEATRLANTVTVKVESNTMHGMQASS